MKRVLKWLFPVLIIACLITLLVAINYLFAAPKLLTGENIKIVLIISSMVCAIIIPFYFYINFLFKKKNKTLSSYIVAGCFVFSALLAYFDYTIKSPLDIFAIDTLLTISIFTCITSFILTLPVLFMKSEENR